MLHLLNRLYEAALSRAQWAPLVWLLKFLSILIREVQREQLHVRAATLAFWSLVSIVPALMLVAVAMRPFGVEAELVRRIAFGALLAGAVSGVGETLDAFVADIDLTGFGLTGTIGVVMTGSQVWMRMEDAYNAIWKVRPRRGRAARLMLFYTTFTVGPILVALGFHITDTLASAVDFSWKSYSAPVLLTAFAFTLGIKLLPEAPVRWQPALVGGLSSALLFEIAKVGFTSYVQNLGMGRTAEMLYGSVALFPVFLLWLFALWFIVLLGVAIAWTLQRAPELMVMENRRLAGDLPGILHPDAFFGLHCLHLVIARFTAGQGALPAAETAHRLALPEATVRQALEVLVECGWLAESEAGFLPTRPAEAIPVGEVVRSFRARTVPALTSAHEDRLERMLAQAGTLADWAQKQP